MVPVRNRQTTTDSWKLNKVLSDNVAMSVNAVMVLRAFVLSPQTARVESVRVARVCYALLTAGLSRSSELFPQVIRVISEPQDKDGGWSDPEETAWAVGAIRLVQGEDDSAVRAAMAWLTAAHKTLGAWGRHPRDKARIPTTALVSALVPEVVRPEDTAWLMDEWQRDFDSPVRLSYKAGFFLLATTLGQEDQLVTETISHLARDQNDDGGFAPWRGHPIGSDPWSTGVVLWGLSRWCDRVDPKVFEKALDWLRASQLPSGYWAYHYLDDGTSLALIGAVAALKALARGR
jgi:hypothetical protein